MKRISVALLGCAFSTSLLFSQGETDAYRYAQTELSGSARSVAMGGAFGALGGDIASLHTNPAGLGVYQTSEVVASLNFTQNKVKTDMEGSLTTDKRFTCNLENIGAALSFNTGSNGGRVNFGFSYNRSYSYNNRYRVTGVDQRTSLLDYIAQTTNRYNNGAGIPETNLKDFNSNAPWLSVLGYNTYLINPVGPENNPTQYEALLSPGELVDSYMDVDERGSSGLYNFSLGGSMLNDHLYLGATIALATMDYRMTGIYEEDFYNGGGMRLDNLDNYLSTTGLGVNAKLGVIVRPINALRIGVAYHTPTRYSMTDYFPATMTPRNIKYGEDQYAVSDKTPEEYFDYNYRTPGKWLVSAAGILGRRAIVSVDWEIANYRQMNLDYYGSSDINKFINEDFRTTHTLRAGIELKVLPQLSLRGGAEFRQSPVKATVRDAVSEGTLDIPTVGTVSNFALDKGANTYTFGVGYRFKSGFYTDMACALMYYNADYYNFSPLPAYNDEQIAVASTRASMKTNRAKVLLSVGYKF